MQQIFKTDESFRTVSFVALVPDTVDRNGDIITENEIVKTAHEFIMNLQKKSVNINHTPGTDTDEVQYVESYVTKEDRTINKNEVLPKGSWIVGMKFSESMFEALQKGEFTGISIEGTGFYA